MDKIFPDYTQNQCFATILKFTSTNISEVATPVIPKLFAGTDCQVCRESFSNAPQAEKVWEPLLYTVSVSVSYTKIVTKTSIDLI